MKQSLLLFLCLFMLLGCDKGLSPPPPKPSISGKVRFLSPWPHKDSLDVIVLALVNQPPPYTDDQLLAGVFNGMITPVIEEFVYGIADTSFYFETDPEMFYYLGVAEVDPLSGEFRILGFAHDAQDSALTFDLTQGRPIDDLTIDVRFDSLPRQPIID